MATERKTVLVTDCGSTTSKALLFAQGEDGWHVAARGEAPTTVEAPIADVTVGVTNAFLEVQEISGRTVMGDKAGSFLVPYLSTSSAGGGLQMVVTGVSEEISGRSAQRAALGAGAIVLETFCADDGKQDFERIEKLRQLKPDIILIAGGTDGGAVEPLLEMVEAVHAAEPKPRFGETLKLPVLFAGNERCLSEVEKLLGNFAKVEKIPNILPTIDDEELKAARDAVHELFLSHVMSHSPGYDKLLKWVSSPILPTPTAVGEILFPYAEEHDLSVLCADIGGATTDVFSTVRTDEGALQKNRTVSANLGMSYSIGNVLLEAGVESIARWIPYKITPAQIRERIRNKMIRPTTIPQTVDDLQLEHAVCREALRLSLDHHISLIEQNSKKRKRGIAEIFTQNEDRGGFSRMNIDLVIGSGGVLSHAPSRMQAAHMMVDGFALEGITELAVDSIFMMPHLGVFAQNEKAGALELFVKECLVRICHSIIPVYPVKFRSQKVAKVMFNNLEVGSIEPNVVTLIPWKAGESGELTVTPLSSSVNIGKGPGVAVTKKIVTGSDGFLLDGRNRPIRFSEGA